MSFKDSLFSLSDLGPSDEDAGGHSGPWAMRTHRSQQCLKLKWFTTGGHEA